MKPKYKRILLKLSGEGLMGDRAFGMDEKVIKELAEQIKAVHDSGVEVCIVVGGGSNPSTSAMGRRGACFHGSQMSDSDPIL